MRIMSKEKNSGRASFRPIGRRHFLKQAGLAAVAPLILSPRLRAAETPPSEQVILGFVGTGTQGKGLMHGFLPRENVRVAAVCDVDTDRRNDAKGIVDRHYAQRGTGGPECAAHSDFRELLERKDIDGVVIATPDHWHALVAIAAAEAGKDIYCEKPMAHTIHEGRAMVKAMRRHKKILQTGSMQRSMSEFRIACELVRNGCIGNVKKADVAVGGPMVPCDLPGEPAQPGLDWDRWLGPAPMRPYNSILSPRGVHKHFPEWRRYMEYGGGQVSDWGAHHFDIVQWAFGFDNTGPVEIIAAEQPGAQEGAQVCYDNGLVVTHRAGNGVTFYGDKGKIYVNRGQFKLWMGDQLRTEDVKEAHLVARELMPADAVRLYESNNQLSDWLACMKSRKLPICDVETGHRTATICSLVNLSYLHHQSIKWDPAHERFRDHTGEASWLTREYRRPWKVA